MFAHASIIALNVAHTLSDTLLRDHSRYQADRIAAPTPSLIATGPSTDAVEHTVHELKNRLRIETPCRIDR